MAMADMELNSFIGKFLHLWQTGHEAYLSLSTNGGQAFVTLSTVLSPAPQFPPPFYQFPPPFPKRPGHVSPSRLRRRKRRKADVQENQKTNEVQEAADDSSDNCSELNTVADTSPKLESENDLHNVVQIENNSEDDSEVNNTGTPCRCEPDADKDSFNSSLAEKPMDSGSNLLNSLQSSNMCLDRGDFTQEELDQPITLELMRKLMGLPPVEQSKSNPESPPNIQKNLEMI